MTQVTSQTLQKVRTRKAERWVFIRLPENSGPEKKRDVDGSKKAGVTLRSV